MSEPRYLSFACRNEAHAGCQRTVQFAACRCWCHSTCAHAIPYLVSDNCERCEATPEEMVPNPAGMRQENAELRRQAAIRARQDGCEQR